MAKKPRRKIRPLDERIEEFKTKEIRKDQKRFKRAVDRDTSAVYRKNIENLGYVAAYHEAVLGVTQAAAEGRISQDQLEHIAAQARVSGETGIRATDTGEVERELSYEGFCKLRETKSYKELKAHYPNDVCPSWEGAYQRYVVGGKTSSSSGKSSKKGVLTGEEYRRIAREKKVNLGDPEQVERFDEAMLKLYIVPHGKGSLRGFRARRHKSSWKKK